MWIFLRRRIIDHVVLRMLENCWVLIGSWKVLNSKPSQWLIPFSKITDSTKCPLLEDVQLEAYWLTLHVMPLRLSYLQTMPIPTVLTLEPGPGWCWLLASSRRVSGGDSGVRLDRAQGPSFYVRLGWVLATIWSLAGLQRIEFSGVFYWTVGKGWCPV